MFVSQDQFEDESGLTQSRVTAFPTNCCDTVRDLRSLIPLQLAQLDSLRRCS
jgi:hypothetical protein